jgi:hypothetical protein
MWLVAAVAVACACRDDGIATTIGGPPTAAPPPTAAACAQIAAPPPTAAARAQIAELPPGPTPVPARVGGGEVPITLDVTAVPRARCAEVAP